MFQGRTIVYPYVMDNALKFFEYEAQISNLRLPELIIDTDDRGSIVDGIVRDVLEHSERCVVRFRGEGNFLIQNSKWGPPVMYVRYTRLDKAWMCDPKRSWEKILNAKQKKILPREYYNEEGLWNSSECEYLAHESIA